MAYIIGSYNQWDKWDRAHSIYTFFIHGIQYAVKEVELSWGLPKLPFQIEDDIPESYHLYEDKDEAIAFAQTLKHLNT